MPLQPTPLFRPEVLRPHVSAFELNVDTLQARERLTGWVELLETPAGLERKETELLPDFLTDVFQRILGYRGPAERTDGRFSIAREKTVEVDGQFADAVLGTFEGAVEEPIIAVEGKGPKDPLDRPYGGRRMSAVDQGYRYAINLLCDWILVTNLREVRLYHKGSTQRRYESFELRELANDDYQFRKFVFLLGAERATPAGKPSHLHGLLEASDQAGEDLTQQFYKTYAEIRHDLLNALLEANGEIPPRDVLSAAQRLLDRALFIAFAEDRSLLPPETLAEAYKHRDPYNPRPVWENFRGLFRAIDQGNPDLGIPRYNGGLFAEHDLLDRRLSVPDEGCLLLKRLGDYNYGNPADAGERDGGERLVDVEILGHIFEQSIEDLEAIRSAIEGGQEDVTRATSKRKREGAFYTPEYVTRYIVTEALQPVLEEAFGALREQHASGASGTTAVSVLKDPRVYDVEALNNPQRDALIAFWESWVEALKSLRVVDPACGSGAFLIELFDALHEQYELATGHLTDLRRGSFAGSLFDPDRTILENNIYGVDLNEEAVEIARLSIWIKTAQRGKILTDLDHNIQVGNSVVRDKDLDARAFDWWRAFPEVEKEGGFDVVVGNPPYVRAEALTALKAHLQEHYDAYHGAADLYVYFYELGVRLLRPGGRMSYVVTNKWFKTAYAQPLRQYFSEKAWVEEVVDLGHARDVFPDADVFPCIVRVAKPNGGPVPQVTRGCTIPRDLLRLEELHRQVESFAFEVPRESLGRDAWTLEPPSLLRLYDRMRGEGIPLAEYAERAPMYGIKTGYNKAFHITGEQRDRLVADHAGCADLIRPYLRGQDVDRWHPSWDGLWLIVMKSAGDHAWPWKGLENDEAEQVFAATYPSLYAHFKEHEDRLRKRSDQGVNWWELRSCDYYATFEGPKIIWKDLSYYAEFAFDETGVYTNDLCFFLPTGDFWLLAVLNSPLMWSYLWRNTVHGKDEVLRLKTLYMENVPIVTPPDAVKAAATGKVKELVEIARRRRNAVLELHDWLEVEFGVDKPGQKLGRPHEIDSDTFIAEVKKRRAGGSSVTGAELRRLRDEFDRVAQPLREDADKALNLESEVSDLVNEAYGLTAEEVELLWKTAPPRMPEIKQSVLSAATQP